jgi:hypothetical protein
MMTRFDRAQIPYFRGLMPVPQEFFTAQSMTTLAGATGITYVVANGCQAAFGFNPKWLALAIAMVVCLVGAAASGSVHSVVDVLVAIFDGFLVFMTARGGSASPQGARALAANEPKPQKRRFASPW